MKRIYNYLDFVTHSSIGPYYWNKNAFFQAHRIAQNQNNLNLKKFCAYFWKMPSSQKWYKVYLFLGWYCSKMSQYMYSFFRYLHHFWLAWRWCKSLVALCSKSSSLISMDFISFLSAAHYLKQWRAGTHFQVGITWQK